jgi:hypothetical protein
MSPDPEHLFCYAIRRLLAIAILFFTALFLASQVELTNGRKLYVFFSGLRATKVFEVQFCIGRLTVFMDILLKADKGLSLFGYWTTM